MLYAFYNLVEELMFDFFSTNINVLSLKELFFLFIILLIMMVVLKSNL